MRVCSVCQRCHDSSVRCEVDGSASDRSPDLRADMIPGYELIELTSSSRASDGYRARETGSQRSCVIKIISADDQSSERLLSEARFAAGLFHPSIVDVYEAGQIDDDRCYVVAEDPAGHTLRDILDNIGAPGLLDSIDIIRQAADALHTLHLAGLTHRAINPSNIVLSATPGGRRGVKLQNIDFGGVSQRAIITDKFTIDSELDSLKYFAPEQCSGEEAAERTDIYSLGIVFYEMLAGAPPFEAANAVALIHKQKNQAPADVRIDNFNLRMLVTHALTESLQKRPSARQSSANLLARQLRHIEQLATRVSTPPPAGTISEPPVVRMPVAVEIEMRPTRYVPPAPALRRPATSTALVVGSELKLDGEAVSVTPQAEAFAAPASLETESVSVVEVVTAEAASEVLTAAHSLRRSRLKGWKKRLHQIAGELAARAENTRVAVVKWLEIDPTRSELTSSSTEPAPKKIEWQQPEDDIPSIADVVETLASDGIAPYVTDAAVRHHQELVEAPKIVLAEAPVVVAEVAQAVEIESDIEPAPVMAEVPVAPISAPVQPSRVARTPEPDPVPKQRKPSYIQFIDVEPPSTTDDAVVQEVQVEPEEEITLVRPPRGRRIRVSFDRQSTPRPNLFVARKDSVYGRQQREFVPTLLGGGNQVAPVVAADTMFSGYPSTRAGRSHRSTFIAIGIFGLSALLLFGNDSLTRYFQTWTAADSLVGTSRQTPQSAEPIVALKTRPGKKSDKLSVPNRIGIAADRGSVESKTKLTASVKPVTSSVRKEDRKKQSVEPPSSAATPTRPRVVPVP